MKKHTVEGVHQLVRIMARSLVDQPDAVEITMTAPLEFRILVPDNQLGQVIGKGGRTARAMRAILASVSKVVQHEISIDIVGRDS